MDRARPAHEIRPSVLDRLIDEGKGGAVLQTLSLQELEACVQRDLEALLNTRAEALDDLAPELSEVRRSLLTYGLPDFTTVDLTSNADRERVQAAIEAAIERFEPRLSEVRVSFTRRQLHDGRSGTGPTLNFRIDAVLRVRPRPAPVSFDTFLEVSSQQYEVRAGT